MLAQRLIELGLTVPPAPQPVAAYVPASRTGNLVFVSGQLPLLAGTLMMTGAMGSGKSTIEAAQAAMQQCFLNALAAASTCVDIASIRKVIRIAAFVASGPDFTDQHLVANGASELALQLFGENGKHARAAVGVASLPLGASVELEVLFEVGE